MTGNARLFVLATLERLGEAHGHQVTREAAASALERWAHISHGALYSALRKCDADGLVSAVRTEQEGKFPPRTVYSLTTEGRQALIDFRASAWAHTGLTADPFDLALTVSGDTEPEQLRAVLESRLQQWTEALAGLLRERATECDHLTPTEQAVFDHVLMRHETEIAWHRQLIDGIDGLLESPE